MKCSDCGVEGHKAGWTWCPGGKLSAVVPKVVVSKVKKPWVKPTLTRWVKAMDTSMDTISSDMDTHGYKYRDREKRKVQMRDYMRRVRGTPGGG